MNAAKIQLSSGHNEPRGAGEPGIYHNINILKEWDVSPEEAALVTNAGWILTKNAIIGKALALFGELSGILQERWRNEAWPEGQQELQAILQVPPRISKGENYKGLPWVVLDYPRCFGRDDVLAVRTLFWWGHYFSVTLHLKGSYKEMFLPVIRDHLPLLGAAGFFIGVSDDEWRHELGQDNYRPVDPGATSEMDAILGRQAFLKFSAKCDLHHWNQAGELLLRLSEIVIQALKS